MAKRWSPKINNAITYLRSSIKHHIAHNEYRLPPLEALAREAGVSVVTMHKALMVLKTEYAIESLPRKGIRIKPETNREDARTAEETRSSTDERMITPETYEFVPKYHHVKDWILADILKGEFAPTNELPKKKELVWRYNASYATITKALQCLVQEKRIYLSKKKYKTFLSIEQKFLSTIIVIAQHSLPVYMASYTQHAHDFFTTLEKEQFRLHFNFKVFSFRDFLNNPEWMKIYHTTIKEVEMNEPVIGYIIFSLSITYTSIIDLLHVLRQTRKPIALFDDTNLADSYPSIRNFTNIHIFQNFSYSKTSGETVGTHLLAQGHYHAAYFSFASPSKWDINRKNGIEEAMSWPNVTKPVRTFEIANINKRAYQDKLENELKEIETLTGGFSRREKLYYQSQYLIPVHEAIAFKGITDKVFRQALKYPEISVWVGANDKIALNICQFLERNDIKITEKIAVVGFDNTFDSLAYNFTSYDFNSAGVVYAILEYLFNYQRYIAPKKPPVTRIPGILIKRSSTALKNIST